jgi:hypothetical protein
MSRFRLALPFALLLAPCLAWAGEREPLPTPPEALLSARSVAFLRVDGFAKHKDAYDQSALADIVNGDVGKFLKTCYRAAVAYTKSEAGDDEAVQIEQFLQAFNAVKSYLFDEGVVLGLEVISVKERPRWQVTFVFPNGGKEDNWKRLHGVMEMFAKHAEVKIQEEDKGGRQVHSFDADENLRFHWWSEAEHVMLVVGTENAETTINRLSRGARRDNLTGHALFAKIQETPRKSGYTPVICGFVDGPQLLELLNASDAVDAKQIAKALGFGGFQGASFTCGFEGKAWRTTCAVHTSGEREALFKLLSSPKAVDLTKLPAMPADATDVRVFSFDFVTAYDVITEAVVGVMKAVSPEISAAATAMIKQADAFVGCDIKKDLLGSLGSTVVYCNSPTDGFWLLGSTVAIEVKNPEKLLECLENMVPCVSRLTGMGMKLHKSHYRGVDVYTIRFDKDVWEGFAVMPCFTIRDGWFVMSAFPQGVQGYILRCQGKAPAWKPCDELVKAFDAAKLDRHAKVVGFSQSDPRPVVKFLASFAPLVSGVLEANLPDEFEPFCVPNPHCLLGSLFPEVSVTLDDGKSIRWESYQAMPIPLNPMALVVGYSALATGGACVCQTWEGGMALPAPMYIERQPVVPATPATTPNDLPRPAPFTPQAPTSPQPLPVIHPATPPAPRPAPRLPAPGPESPLSWSVGPRPTPPTLQGSTNWPPATSTSVRGTTPMVNGGMIVGGMTGTAVGQPTVGPGPCTPTTGIPAVCQPPAMPTVNAVRIQVSMPNPPMHYVPVTRYVPVTTYVVAPVGSHVRADGSVGPAPAVMECGPMPVPPPRFATTPTAPVNSYPVQATQAPVYPSNVQVVPPPSENRPIAVPHTPRPQPVFPPLQPIHPPTPVYPPPHAVPPIGESPMLPPPLQPADTKKTTIHVYAVGDLLTPAQDVQSLLRIIKLVQPESWDGNGGSIEFFEKGEAIVVRQTAEAHEQIDKLLKDLRDVAGSAKPKKRKVTPLPPPVTTYRQNLLH